MNEQQELGVFSDSSIQGSVCAMHDEHAADETQKQSSVDVGTCGNRSFSFVCRSRQRKISDGHAQAMLSNAAQTCCSSEKIEEQSEYNAGMANKKKERRNGVHAACLQGVFKSWLQSRGYASSERCVCCAALQYHAVACLWHALCLDCLAIS